MTKKVINQNSKLDKEFLNTIKSQFIFVNKAINRFDFITRNDESNKNAKNDLLDNLKNQLNSIENCKLKENSSNLVFGRGNINSPLMLIGEAPGIEEEKSGIPFQGEVGELLNKMLQAINLDRTKVYITNVVNYRPPENRKPSEEEILRYLPFLVKHIEIIKPKILVLLGSTALNSILGSEKVISKARGIWVTKQIGSWKTNVIASFHPAYLMRQPDQKKHSWVDLKMIKKKLEDLNIKIDN